MHYEAEYKLYVLTLFVHLFAELGEPLYMKLGLCSTETSLNHVTKKSCHKKF